MNSKFHITKPFTEPVDNERHPLFQDVSPLSPKQMLYRQLNNMPITVSQPQSRFTINNRFHSGDKLDVYDALYKQKKAFDERMKKSKETVQKPVSDVQNPSPDAQDATPQ